MMLQEEVTFPEDVRAALDAGKLWRAKEILGGRVGAAPFDAKLYEQHGVVLLKMGDLVEAGRFLFVSGARRTEYDEALGLFRDHFGRAGWKAVLGALPGQAKRVPIGSLPIATQEDLRSLGLPVGYERKEAKQALQRKSSKLLNVLATGGCLLVVLSVLASLAAGAPLVFKTVMAWFR